MSVFRFVAGGGANHIGGSHYVLFAGDVPIGFDFGSYLQGEGEVLLPKIVAPIKHLILTHGHFDHVGMVPVARRLFPGLKIYASVETAELARILWGQTLRKCDLEGTLAPFTLDEANEARKSIIELPLDGEELYIDGISVTPISAGHILGAKSFVVEVDGEVAFVTGDVSYRNRSLIKGASKFEAPNGIKLLVRESTYITQEFEETREKVIERFIKATTKTLEAGGQVLVPALSIDRAQDIFCIYKASGIDSKYPLYIDGSRSTFGVYRDFLPDGHLLDSATWFESKRQKSDFLKSRRPGMVISSSGMVYKDTPSAWWAQRLLGVRGSSVFFVNYQDPNGPGFGLVASRDGQHVFVNGVSVRRQCNIEQFEFSSHMDGLEGEDLERRLNPETTIYIHGDEYKIDAYLALKSGDGQRRIKAMVGQEVSA